jgi:hypothetical protein
LIGCFDRGEEAKAAVFLAAAVPGEPEANLFLPGAREDCVFFPA